MSRTRLDHWMVEQGLAESRSQARQWILAGRVRVNGQVQSKAGWPTPAASRIEVAGAARFVGRGGEKIEAALDAFALDVRGRVCLDVGASTGGFSDCLLQRGARRVYALDVGRGQLHWKLRQDPRVVVMEGVNARHVQPSDLPERMELAVVDVSFISLTKILPALMPLLRDDARLVALVKPQFEAGRDQVCRGGVVRDAAVHQAVLDRIRAFGGTIEGLDWIGTRPSPIQGLQSGNIEFLMAWRYARQNGP